MRASLDCIPCFLRQTLDAARVVSEDPAFHESVLRQMVLWLGDADLGQPPPRFAQHIHRHLRAVTGVDDPYRAAKDRQNQMGLRLMAELREQVESASDPLDAAARLAVAGNTIDMGVATDVTESDLRRAVDEALRRPLHGEPEEFRRAVMSASKILYLADNAGEIALDLLLVEQLGPGKVTVAVRGAPVLNDATLIDARAVGLDRIVEVLDNGSDAPGTLLADCSERLQRQFAEADLVVSKGQGNFESLSEEPGNIFFLFRVKCGVIADRVGMPVETHVVMRSPNCRTMREGRA